VTKVNPKVFAKSRWRSTLTLKDGFAFWRSWYHSGADHDKLRH